MLLPLLQGQEAHQDYAVEDGCGRGDQLHNRRALPAIQAEGGVPENNETHSFYCASTMLRQETLGSQEESPDVGGIEAAGGREAAGCQQFVAAAAGWVSVAYHQ